MQHVYEYILVHDIEEYNDEGTEHKTATDHQYYVTQSSRYSKVAKRILEDKNITTNNVKSFQLRKIR